MIEKVGIYHDPKRKLPWLVRWFEEPDVSGKSGRRAKSFRLNRDAERFRAAKQKEFNDGAKRSKPSNISLATLCEKVLAIRKPGLRQASIWSYKNTISQLLSYFKPETPVRRIGTEQAEQFVASRELVHPDHKSKGKELSAWGRNQHLAICSAIFAKAVAWDYLPVNPFVRIKKATEEGQPWHHIIPSEFEDILRVTPDCRERAFYAVMYGAGLRFGEAVNLLWNGRDIDFERGRVEITSRDGTAGLPPFLVKDHERRSLLLPGWTLDLLLRAHAFADEGCPFAFLRPERYQRVTAKWRNFQREDRAKEWQNHHVCNNSLRKFKARCRKAGIVTNNKLTIHCLRKSYAQNLADACTPIHTLKKLMGHSSVKTLECFYLRTSNANEIQALGVLDRLYSGESDTRLTLGPPLCVDPRKGQIAN
ncbi:MAG: site-specific integrase [Phycisphaerae bacterium]|nr:site-specific integrase [Phycisphaerae bacterium]